MAGTGTSPSGVPLFDLRLEPEDVRAVAEVLESGWLTLGPRTHEFETAFASTSASATRSRSRRAPPRSTSPTWRAGVGPGDEVIVPSLTFAATAAAVIYCGGTPVFADILGPHDLGLDPEDVERRIGPRTKAVVRVHFAGYPAAVDRLRALCDAHGLALIEDAAHAPSADFGGRRLGAWGRAGAFSFFSNKVLSCGEGGLLATDDDDVAALARSLRSHGMISGARSGQTRRDRFLRRRRPRLQLPPRRAPLGAAALPPRPARGPTSSAGASSPAPIGASSPGCATFSSPTTTRASGAPPAT